MKGGLRPGLLPCEERVIDARRKTVSVLTAWAHTAEREKRKKEKERGAALLGCWWAGCARAERGNGDGLAQEERGTGSAGPFLFFLTKTFLFFKTAKQTQLLN